MSKVAFVISGMTSGGAENSIVNMLEELTKDNLITIYIMQTLDNEIVIPSYSNLEVSGLEARSLTDIKSFFKLKSRLKSYDIVIGQLLWAQYWTGLVGLFDKSLRRKILWVEHNEYISKRYWHWLIIKILGRFTRKIIAVSDEVSLSFSQRTNLKTEVIYNAISVPENYFTYIDNVETPIAQIEPLIIGIESNGTVGESTTTTTTQEGPKVLRYTKNNDQ